ncbi:MAG: TolC family protein [Rubripirellula sp.]
MSVFVDSRCIAQSITTKAGRRTALLLSLLTITAGCRSAAVPQIADQAEEGRFVSSGQTDAVIKQATFKQPTVTGEVEQPDWVRVAENLSDRLGSEHTTLGVNPIDSFPAESSSPATLPELESLAVSTHPALAEMRSQVEAARGKMIQAGLPFNPVLQYQSDEIFNDDSSGIHSLTLSQQYVTANKLGIAQQVQLQAVQKQQAQLNLEELRVRTQVRIAFARTLVAQQRVELTKQLVMLSDESTKSVLQLFEAEEVSKVSLLQARVEKQQVQLTAENAATQLEASRMALTAAAAIQDLPPILIGDLRADLTEKPWNELLDQIQQTSPEMASAGSELERARRALQLACAQITPNITGQVGLGVDTSTDDTFARLGVSVPLPIRNRNQGNLRTARANISAASAAIDRTQLDLASRLSVAVSRYATARQRAQRLDNHVLPMAQETLELSRQAFEAGESTFLELLTAQRTLFTTRLSSLEALGQAREALAEIEGLLVSSS